MGWLNWTAGLILFDILMIILIQSFAAGGEDIGTSSYDVDDINFTAQEDLSITKPRGFFDGFFHNFSIMPWWVNMFLVTFNAALIVVLIAALIRGFN